jgi:hypothetical protein
LSCALHDDSFVVRESQGLDAPPPTNKRGAAVI